MNRSTPFLIPTPTFEGRVTLCTFCLFIAYDVFHNHVLWGLTDLEGFFSVGALNSFIGSPYLINYHRYLKSTPCLSLTTVHYLHDKHRHSLMNLNHFMDSQKNCMLYLPSWCLILALFFINLHCVNTETGSVKRMWLLDLENYGNLQGLKIQSL